MLGKYKYMYLARCSSLKCCSSDVHSWLFPAVTSSKEMIGSRAAWTEALLSTYHDTLVLKPCLMIEFHNKNWQNLKAETLFHIKTNKAQSFLCLLEWRHAINNVLFKHQLKTT